MTNLPDEADAILALLRADLLASVGMPLEARVRLISPEEQRARDLELDARSSDPNAKVVLLGSTTPGPLTQPLEEYSGFWELEMPHTRSMISEAVDVIDVVQEEVIEDLWRMGRSASWPECPCMAVTHSTRCTTTATIWYGDARATTASPFRSEPSVDTVASRAHS